MAMMRNDVEERDYRRRIRIHKQKVVGTIVGIVVAIAIVGGVVLRAYWNRTFYGYEVIKTIPRTDNNTVKYESYNGKLLKYSRDGASVIDKDGNILWNGSYSMKTPKAVYCGDYVAIADIGEKQFYVFNGSDSGTRVDVLLPIMDIEVASQGVVAVLMEGEDSNLFNLYYPYSTGDPVLVNRQTSVQTNGYPIDIALSQDGQKLVTSYISVNNGVLQSNVTFYNFGEVGQNAVDKMVGMEDYGQTIIPKIKFLNNNIVCVYQDNGFSLFSMKEIQEKIYSETFDTEIKSTFSTGSYIGFVLYDAVDSEKYQVIVYDLKGKQVLNKSIAFDYDKVLMAGEDILFYANLDCHILRLNGKSKFSYSFNRDIEYLVPINRYNKFFSIDNTNIEIIKLVEEKDS